MLHRVENYGRLMPSGRTGHAFVLAADTGTTAFMQATERQDDARRLADGYQITEADIEAAKRIYLCATEQCVGESSPLRIMMAAAGLFEFGAELAKLSELEADAVQRALTRRMRAAMKGIN